MASVLTTQEETWLNHCNGLAQGIVDYWTGADRAAYGSNDHMPWAGWNHAAAADTLNVAGNTHRGANGFSP